MRLILCGYLLLGLAATAQAQFPAQDMDSRSLGFGYNFALRGQDITKASVSGNEVVHQALLAYSPVPYAEVQFGLGMDRFSVAPHNGIRFEGDYSFSPSFGLSLYSPFFAADMLRGTGGLAVQSFSSEDGRGFRYSAFVSNPYLGLIFSPTVFLDLGLGARGHLLNGTMTSRTGTKSEFANQDIGRGYVSLTLKTPFERSFLHLDADFSPSVQPDWADGPREATISLTVGAILGWKGPTGKKPNVSNPVNFPAYGEMKDKQDKMAEELQ